MELVALARADKDVELLNAITTGDRTLLQAVKAQSLHGASLLHHTVEAGSVKCTRMLIEKRLIDVNVADESGATPLHRAVAEGHTAVVKLLLEKFADVDVKDSRGETPLHTAAYRGDVVLARMLLEKGANIDAKSGIGYTPLHAAAKEGRSDLISFLIVHGAKLNLVDINNQTAKQLAMDEVVEARVQTMKKAEEMDELRAAVAKAEKEAQEARDQLAEAQRKAEEAEKKTAALAETNSMIQASLQEALMELSVYKAKERADAAAAVETPVDLAPRIKEMEATHKEAQEEARKKAEENEVKIKVLTAKVDELTASLQNVEKHKSEAAAVNNKLTAELEDVRNELEKAYQTIRHSDGEREIVQVVLQNSVAELEKNEATRKEMEAKLKAAGMKVFELTSAMENMQKNNDALQRKVATPVQVQILDKSPVAGQQQELAASVTQLQESYKHLKALFTQSEQALSQVGARIEGVKDKAGKAPVIGGGQN